MDKTLFETNRILQLTFNFSLSIITFCELLDINKKYIVSKQLFRSATSIGANAMEAQNAESKPDFIHKMKLAAKEADESQYWLQLYDASVSYPDCKELLDHLEEIQKVLNKIITSAKNNN